MRSNPQDNQIRLRCAKGEDARMVFRWRNDPYLIARGSSQRAVTWAEHQEWFKENQRSDHRVMFIIQRGRLPLGQIRFDRLNNSSCVISVYLLEEFTHKGYGVSAIRYGCREIFNLWDIQEVVAYVRHDNPVARLAFIKAGFIESDPKIEDSESHYTIRLARSNAMQFQ